MKAKRFRGRYGLGVSQYETKIDDKKRHAFLNRLPTLLATVDALFSFDE
jgi:hypothetical protein